MIFRILKARGSIKSGRLLEEFGIGLERGGLAKAIHKQLESLQASELSGRIKAVHGSGCGDYCLSAGLRSRGMSPRSLPDYKSALKDFRIIILILSDQIS